MSKVSKCRALSKFMTSKVYLILVEQLSDVSFIERALSGVREHVLLELFVVEEPLNRVLKVGGVQGGDLTHKGHLLGHSVYVDLQSWGVLELWGFYKTQNNPTKNII